MVWEANMKVSNLEYNTVRAFKNVTRPLPKYLDSDWVTPNALYTYLMCLLRV